MATSILIGQWHQELNAYEARDKLIILRQLARFNQSAKPVSDQDRRSLDLEGVIEQVDDIIAGLGLKPGEDTRPIISEIVERSGLLLAVDGGQRYQFARLTLQESFFASALGESPTNLLEWYKKDPYGWREAVKLWCGLSDDIMSVVKADYQVDPLVSLEYLVETKNIDPGHGDKIVEVFKGRLDESEPEEAALRALGGVAADHRPRGMRLLDDLQSCLVNHSCSSPQFQNAAQALTFSNSPAAAGFLARHYTYEVRDNLRGMGDLAVPYLGEIAHEAAQYV